MVLVVAVAGVVEVEDLEGMHLVVHSLSKLDECKIQIIAESMFYIFFSFFFQIYLVSF
jgi:hypothetical protein